MNGKASWLSERGLLLIISLLTVGSSMGCIGRGMVFESRPDFGDSQAIISSRDEQGGRFHGARVSPGFGVLYRSGYTIEEAQRAACGGYFGEDSEHVLEIYHAMPLKLVVHSSTPLVLGVVDEQGVLTCWDDQHTVNENVSLSLQYIPGRYEVLIGDRQQHMSTSYRLVISE